MAKKKFNLPNDGFIRIEKNDWKEKNEKFDGGFDEESGTDISITVFNGHNQVTNMWFDQDDSLSKVAAALRGTADIIDP